MEQVDWVGIYKGLRLPILGVLFLVIVWYVFRPSKKKDFEDVKYTAIDDD